MIDKLLPEEFQEEQIYKLTMKFLSDLSENEKHTKEDTMIFLNRALTILGYEYTGSKAALIPYIEELINAKVPMRDII